MMDYQNQLKLQSYLDGELSAAEVQEVKEWLAKDPAAEALLTELRQTNEALSGFEEGIKLPESREFHWSKIKRAIESQEQRARATEPVAPVPWSVRLRRFLMPAAGVAVIALVSYISVNPGRPTNGSVETSLADSGAVVYHDYSAGATFVWLSYPPDSDLSEEDDTGALD
jgi:anti-sigma factor RsiW